MELGIGGLESEKVAIGPGGLQTPILRARLYAAAQGDRRLGVPSLDAMDRGGEALRRVPGVLGALEHEAPKARVVCFLRRRDEFVLGKAIAYYRGVARSDPAVEAVEPAVVREFYEGAQEDLLPVDFLAYLARRQRELLGTRPAVVV